MPSRKLKDSHRPLHAACRIRFCLRKAAAVRRCRILGSVLSLARPHAKSSNTRRFYKKHLRKTEKEKKLKYE